MKRNILLKVILIVIIFIITSCEKNKKINPFQIDKLVIDSSKKFKNEVVLKLKDSTDYFLVNIMTTPSQMKWEPITIGIKNKKSVVVIPTDSILDLAISGGYRYLTRVQFKKGDTVFLTGKKMMIYNESIIYPFYTVANRKVNPYELNFDYFVNLNTPTLKTFRGYSMFSKFKKWKNLSTFYDVYANTIAVSDSLYSKNLISKDFYTQKQKEAKIFKANIQLKKAHLNKTIKALDSLNISLSDSTFSKNRLYINYLITTVKYKFFFSRKNHIRDSELFDVVINKNTSIIPILKKAILDDLLKGVYLSERSKFNSRLEKLKSFNKYYPLLVKKYESVLAIERKNKAFHKAMKNSTGKLLTLKEEKTYNYQDILNKEKGKVVLVDFWASWCVPCRMEMPSLKKLNKELDSTKFTAISISIDKSVTAWKKASIQEELDKRPNNYLLVNAEKSSLISDFKINMIPRYLLYDTLGNLIDYNAARPSDKNLKQLILKLLNSKK